jgi:hypothetical protein
MPFPKARKTAVFSENPVPEFNHQAEVLRRDAGGNGQRAKMRNAYNYTGRKKENRGTNYYQELE